MSAEVLNPHSVEVPTYREMFRHFGRKAIKWALGTNVEYNRPIEQRSNFSVATTPTGELTGDSKNLAEWTTSESAKTRSEQMAARVAPVEIKTAHAAGYVIGADPSLNSHK